MPNVGTLFYGDRGRSISPTTEAELLLWCARTSLGAATIARVRERLAQGADWAHLLRLARVHGVEPLLYRNLSRVQPDAVPATILDELRDRYHATAQRNLSLAAQLLRLLRLLDAHRITAVPFKGPAMATVLYGDLSLRQFADLDILIRRQDLAPATGLLLGRGYELVRDFAPAQGLEPGRFEYEFGFRRPGDRAPLEVHWAFAQSYYAFPIDPDGLWGRLQPIMLAGQTVPSLAPDDLLLLLCAHGAKHEWRRLEWLVDVAELLRAHPDLPWGALLERSARAGAQRMLHAGLLLAGELLDAPLPAGVACAIRADRGAAVVAARVRRQFFHDAGRNAADETDLALFSFLYYRSRERRLDRLRYVRRTLAFPWLVEHMPFQARLSLAVRLFPAPGWLVTPAHALLRLMYRVAWRGEATVGPPPFDREDGRAHRRAAH